LRADADDRGSCEYASDESAATCDRLEWDPFVLVGQTCFLRSIRNCWASHPQKSHVDQSACDEDNGVCASEGLRSRDDTGVVCAVDAIKIDDPTEAVRIQLVVVVA
jgi:hypothetical protein